MPALLRRRGVRRVLPGAWVFLVSAALLGELAVPVHALFVDAKGIYPELLGTWRTWTGSPNVPQDDARNYAGPHPVVAHPPCNLWVNMAAVNWKRYENQLPAWYQGGTDGGCFAAALTAVRKYGGVLEHPAGSHAWGMYGLNAPNNPVHGDPSYGWCRRDGGDFEYSCEVWQSAYGHRARKRTWLHYVGKRPPFELRWTREPGTHQVGWFDRAKPTLSKREASATPEMFARELIRLAEWSAGT